MHVCVYTTKILKIIPADTRFSTGLRKQDDLLMVNVYNVYIIILIMTLDARTSLAATIQYIHTHARSFFPFFPEVDHSVLRPRFIQY